MRKTKTFTAILCIAMFLTLIPATALADDKVTEVGTVAELRAALENDAGAHVRLTKDIIFTRANATDKDAGVTLGTGCYTIDLNGHTIKYHYMTGGEFSDQGDTITLGGAGRDTKMLIIYGPGSIIGGITGIRSWSNKSTLIVNGGTIKGIMGNGITGGGLIYVNGGTVIGNFGSIEYEQGIVILNGGDVKKVNYRSFDKKSEQENGYGVIRNGVFTGHAVLNRFILNVNDLTISEGSSMKVMRNGGLIVKNNLVNKGTFTYEGGLKSIGGEATVKPNPDGSHSPPEIIFDVSFNSLDIQENGHLRIGNGATVTVTGAFSTGRNSSVVAENGTLRLLGSIDHKGWSEGVPELAALEEHGGEPGPGGGRNYDRETDAAHRLRDLGLFQGVGTHPDGGINFELERVPSRTEALVMLIRLLGKEDEALNNEWEHPFTDVPGWADKLVGYAYEKGLTKGVSPTEFGTGTASVQMYLTFVLRALGYSDGPGGDFTWDAPERFAQGVGILPGDVYMEDFRRSDMVLISEAALFARLKDSDITLLDKLIEDGAVQKSDYEVTQPGNVAVIDSLDKVSGVLLEGSSCQLMIKDANGIDITWSSSNSDIVSVDHSGVIRANRTGNATITGTYGDGVATCTIDVVRFDIHGAHKLLEPGECFKLEVNQHGKKIPYTWESSDPSKATVDSDGNVYAVPGEGGEVDIRLVYDALYGKGYIRVPLTVRPLASLYTFNEVKTINIK